MNRILCCTYIVAVLNFGCGSSNTLEIIENKNRDLNSYLTITKNELHLCRRKLNSSSDACEDKVNKIKGELTFCYQEKNYVLSEINRVESAKRSCVRENVSLRQNLKRVSSMCNAVCEDCD